MKIVPTLATAVAAAGAVQLAAAAAPIAGAILATIAGGTAGAASWLVDQHATDTAGRIERLDVDELRRAFGIDGEAQR